jgi:hypothetical protein
MKKLFLIPSVILLLSLFSANTKAQWTGGGEQQGAQKKATKILMSNKDFFKLGFAMPSGDFGNETGTNAGNANTGLAIHIGGIRYLDFDANNDQFSIGYNFSTAFSYNSWENSSLNASITDIKYRPYYFLGFGLGPMVSISPADQLIVDVFFNIKPTMSVFAGWKSDSMGPETQRYSNPAFILGTNFGANVRYGSFIFGLDLMPGEFTYSMITEVDGDETSGSPTDGDIDTSTLNLTFGILF